MDDFLSENGIFGSKIFTPIWPPFLKEAFFLGRRSWLCDVRLVERLGPLPPDIHTEYNRGGGTGSNSGSINLFITICDYDEEKKIRRRRKKDTRSYCQRDLPSGHPALKKRINVKKTERDRIFNTVCPPGIRRNSCDLSTHPSNVA